MYEGFLYLWVLLLMGKYKGNREKGRFLKSLDSFCYDSFKFGVFIC